MFVHVSRLIPKPLSRTRKNCLERGDHESRINKNLNHVSREKKSPDHVSRKKYREPSINGRERYCLRIGFLSRNETYISFPFFGTRIIILGQQKPEI